ncbi:MAG: response regulator [Spirochaetales bacterium]|uniref:Response regulator n=1 Tax=Candidatus Thalassospirochaeta sargassi TaxID=3119039 RepID=A0AAJ1MJK4_9SPIO|nr:response regulator [Spirochaetales bacterium]
MIGLKKDGSPYSVMIVDDSIFVQKSMTKILESEGFKIIDTAGHGREAVDKYQSLHPQIDMVTMDVTMPGMHGIEALKEIKEFDSEACVIMVSALGKTDIMKDALMLGAAHYIVKPIDKNKLLKTMEYAIQSKI